MEWIGLISMLGVCSLEDIKTRRIKTVAVLFFGILGILCHLIAGSISIWSILGGMAVGGIIFMVASLSDEKIGKGDGLLLVVTGIYLGFWGNIVLLWGASLLAGAVGLVLLVMGKRQASIPFIPFVAVMYLIMEVAKHVP